MPAAVDTISLVGAALNGTQQPRDYLYTRGGVNQIGWLATTQRRLRSFNPLAKPLGAIEVLCL